MLRFPKVASYIHAVVPELSTIVITSQLVFKFVITCSGTSCTSKSFLLERFKDIVYVFKTGVEDGRI